MHVVVAYVVESVIILDDLLLVGRFENALFVPVLVLVSFCTTIGVAPPCVLASFIDKTVRI